MRAIVLDCDGVLIDSEGLAWQAWNAALGRHGRTASAAEVERLLGRSAPEIAQWFAASMGVDAGELTAAVATELAALFESRLRRFDDALPLIEAAKARGLRLAVASSSDRPRLLRSLEIVGLDSHFEVVVSGDDVRAGKPAPDLYLEAARRLGVPPAECIAVEDTPVGVESARAAGLYVVAVTRPHIDPAGVQDADLVVGALGADVLTMTLRTAQLRSVP